jgi:quercetin dioxygenase-like cupin family protein
VDWRRTLPATTDEFFSREHVVEVADAIHATRLVDLGHLAVDVVHVGPMRAFTPHRHRGAHLLMTSQGTGFFYLDGVIAHLDSSVIIEVPPGTVHCLGAGEGALIATVVSIPPSSLVAEQRGTPIGAKEAAALVGGVVCSDCSQCDYVARTRALLINAAEVLG